MAKDNSPGLLSKVARFIRHPTTNWADLDRQEPEQDSGYDKQALKEMIERKRQNDFVRKREFDQLRKLRRSELAGDPNRAGRPSFFPSSIPANQDDRAMTLKKIDEIEAQMSKQWWKGKQDELTGRGNQPPVSSTFSPVDSVLSPPAQKPGKKSAGGFSVTGASLSLNASSGDGADFAPTQMGFPFSEAEAPMAVPEPVPGRPAASPAAVYAGDGSSAFSSSKLSAVELGGGAMTDPDLEDAAIRFANGDDAGAEAGLLDALQRDNVPPDLADAWMAALFDLYRATGQQTPFDSAAIDFAERFGRSAPAWFSMPDLLGRKDNRATTRLAVSSPTAGAVWTSPAKLHVQALQELRAALVSAASPWHLNWGPLVSMEPDTVDSLAKLFSDWCEHPVRLRFSGSESLEKMLRSATPSGDAGVNPAWWKLRMDALRILGRQDEFDLVALDYCVTYEVSPPSWQEARCEYVYVNTNSSTMPAGDGAGVRDGAVASQGGGAGQVPPVSASPESAPAVVVELTGDLVGDAAQALGKLETGLDGANRLVVSCARLIRVDFSAAGSILNWVATRQAAGCQVQFRDVHRLVAAFFNVIGINEHARVVLRTN